MVLTKGAKKVMHMLDKHHSVGSSTNIGGSGSVSISATSSGSGAKVPTSTRAADELQQLEKAAAASEERLAALEKATMGGTVLTFAALFRKLVLKM